MITSPSVDQILEGVILSLDDEIMPALGANPKAYATGQMIQSLLQGVRQMLPVMDGQLVDEHNDMIRALREVAEAIGDASGDAADRVRRRADIFGGRAELPVPPDRDAIITAHSELNREIEASFIDLDELQREGVTSADAAVEVIRGHLAPRIVRTVETITVGAGFVGRS